MSNKSIHKGNDRIISLAKEISESRDRKVPGLLLLLRPILKESPAGTEAGTRIRNEIWQYNLAKVMMLVLRQDYSIISGEWETAAELAHLLSDVLTGLVLDTKSQRVLEEDCLPKGVENMLLLTRHIHGIINATPETKEGEKTVTDLLIYIKIIMDALVKLCFTYFFACIKVMSSQWLLQLLVSDNSHVANITMTTMDKLLKLDRHVLSRVEEGTVLTLLDELVYKLTVNTNVSVAESACRCILNFCDCHSPSVDAIRTRYKGLRPLLRRWEGQGFDRQLRHIASILDSASADRARNQRKNDCARFIQAVWKGYSARSKLRKANEAFKKFHKSYRLKVARAEQVKLETQYKSELYHQMKLRRQQLMRQFYEKRLHTLEILPASRIEDFLKKEKSVAATRIQTIWRGHRERQQLSQRQEVAQQVRAVIKIQRAFRRWLEQVDATRQEFPTHLKPPGLTDVRREELMKQINQWREQNVVQYENREDVEAKHKQAQVMLARHYKNTRGYRKLQYTLENLVARLDTDMELVALAPTLPEVTIKDVEMYSSRSLPVATLAKSQHNNMMKKLQQPWWKTLGLDDDEYDEEERERVEAEVLLETMGV